MDGDARLLGRLRGAAIGVTLALVAVVVVTRGSETMLGMLIGSLLVLLGLATVKR